MSRRGFIRTASDPTASPRSSRASSGGSNPAVPFTSSPSQRAPTASTSDLPEMTTSKQLWRRTQHELNRLEQSHHSGSTSMQRLQRLKQQMERVTQNPETGKRGDAGEAQKQKQFELVQTLAEVYQQGIQQATQEQTIIENALDTLRQLQQSSTTSPVEQRGAIRHANLAHNNGVTIRTSGGAPTGDTNPDHYESNSSSTSSTPVGTSTIPILVGTNVAAKTSKNDEWILAVVTEHFPDRNRFTVEDVVRDEGEANIKYTLSPKSLIPLPHPVPLSPNGTTVSSAVFPRHDKSLPKSARQFQPKQAVLALYPNTTCFYKATIISPLNYDTTSSHYGHYLLRFEDDGDVERHVPHSMVLDLPRGTSKPKPY